MDYKAWWNIAVNLFSFSLKVTTWSVILNAYDPKLEKEMGPIPYAHKLWDDQGFWFLFDYFGAYLIKISIYIFIFEMRQIL